MDLDYTNTSPTAVASDRRHTPRASIGGALATLAFGLATAEAGAATLFVANTGSDGPSCGTAAAPCRTISQGVAVAADGDRIVVQPGVYGDVDGDGEFVSAGDEPAEYDGGCNCLVRVDKSVSIVSQAGAGATILRGAVDGLIAVNISAPGVVLGKKKQGFSIVGDPQHDGYGLWVGAAAPGARIEGNVFSRLETAVFVAGSGAKVVGNRIAQTITHGIYSEGDGSRIAANVVEQTGTFGGNDSAIHVVGTPGAGHTIEGNLVVGNFNLGIYLVDGSPMAAGGAHVVRQNLVVGNGRVGIKVALAADSRAATVVENSIYNNDNVSGTNCGLLTLSAGPVIDATNNFWGTAGGPGANPNDDVCTAGTPPNVGSPAATAFTIVAPPMR